MTALSHTGPNARLWPIMALLCTMVFWGAAPVFLRTTALSLSPENSLALRYAALTIINVAGLLMLGTWRIPREDWPRFLIAGVVGMAGFNYFINQGFARVAAGLGTIITMSEPLLIALLAWIMLREQLSRTIVVGLAVSLIGTLILFWPDIVDAQTSKLSYIGVAALLACSFCWALYTILVKPLLERHDPFTVTAVTMTISAPFLIPQATEPLATLAAKLDMRQWLELAFLVIPNGIVATMLWNYGAKHLPGAMAGAFLFLLPVIAVICGALILDEAVTVWIVAGGALMLAGVAIAQFGLPRLK
jgi:drug/metabolite transporter (DMT)-like permease